MKPMSYAFQSRRSMVLGSRGMVATSNPLATQAGLNILRMGGNAADAAVASAAVLNVTEPASTGIGGDCFALFYDAKSQRISALNGSGAAPSALTAEMLRSQGFSTIPERSVHAITVPGAAAGWEDLLRRHGSMTLKDVLADAIYYAREGYPVHPIFGDAWQRTQAFLLNSPHTQDYLPGGLSPHVGQAVRLPGLAQTLQRVAEGGAEAFYTGEIADAIVNTIQALGGVMTHDDLKRHTSLWQEPIQTNYRDVTIFECPPNGQGLAALIALNIASGFDLGALEWDSPERIHLMVESMRLAFADARHYIADPQTNPAPLDALLSPEYARERRALVSYDQAMQPPEYGAPLPGSNTVYLSVVDGQGNACSFINSNYMGFGTGIVPKGWGFTLQNRGHNFSLDENHPNVLAPGKRPYHTIIPAMVTRVSDNSLYASYGVMGGFMQPQGHVQVLSALKDGGLDPQSALDLPRFCLDADSNGGRVDIEEGMPTATVNALREMGHSLNEVSGYERAVFGRGQVILRDEAGVLCGGSDP
ncbi:MAG: gamma-glutamyltransferase, partial [Anaerolineae bacterium]|nr:gamma-glutamyltransferase [Anaerolineae bacterium]